MDDICVGAFSRKAWQCWAVVRIPRARGKVWEKCPPLVLTDSDGQGRAMWRSLIVLLHKLATDQTEVGLRCFELVPVDVINDVVIERELIDEVAELSR